MLCKCLSVMQPWASDIASGDKDMEFRDWRTAYRGPLAIAACKVPVVPDCDRYGEVVCVVQVTGMEEMPDWGWAWVLSNPVPVAKGVWPIRGRQGLFGVVVPKELEGLFTKNNKTGE